MAVAKSRDAFKELKKIFPDIPDQCVSLTIELGINEPAIVKAKCFTGVSEAGKLKYKLTEYKVSAIEDEKCAMCNGTGEYVGLQEKRPCPQCGGGSNP